jgi:segregation and condensation protein A
MADMSDIEAGAAPQAGSGGQRFSLGEFEGPLDLLLFLIRKNEVNIYDIPIAEITEQYLGYLQYATRVDLDNITEFYVMAATLLYIKSRMLLPVELDLEDEMEDPRRVLVDQLVEYQRYKKLSELISRAQDESEYTLERRKDQIALPFQDDDLWEDVAVWDLLKVFSRLISSISDERVFDLYEQVTVNEKITLINEILGERSDFTFEDLIGRGRRTVIEIVCSLLAVLELIKSRVIVVQQNRMFGDIRISKREDASGLQ